MKKNKRFLFVSVLIMFALVISVLPNNTVLAAGLSDANSLVAIAKKEQGNVDSLVGYKYSIYTNTKSQAWCASFVAWCANQAGISTSVIPNTANCSTMRTKILNSGGQKVSTPQAGDLVFYYDNNASRYAHVGIMIDYTNSIQGNVSNSVMKLSSVYNYRLGYQSDAKKTNYSVEYVRPNYNLSSSTSSSASFASVTTSNAQSITQNSAILYGSAVSTGGKMTQCGMMIGTSSTKSNLTKLGSDTINTYSTSMWYSTSKYGYTLQPGTTYYYCAYAVVGGVPYYGDTLSFTTQSATAQTASISLNKSSLSMQDNVCVQLTATTTPGGQAVSWTSSNPSVATVSSSGGVTGLKAGTTTITASMTYEGKTYSASCQVTVTATNSVTYTVSGASGITQTTARVDASCYYTGTRPTTVGLYLGTSKSNLSYYGSDTLVSTATNNPVSVWYNLTNLSAGTTYYYQFYAVVSGTTYTSSIYSFTTTAKASGTASYTVSGASGITQTTARVDASCYYTGTRPTTVGLYLGTSSSSLSYYGSDTLVSTATNNPVSVWYNLTNLSAGTTYYYQFYAVVSGTTYTSSIYSFTTAKVSGTASYTVSGASGITQTTARVDASCYYTGTRPTTVGLYLGTSSSSLSYYGSDTLVSTATNNPVSVWYNLTNLSAGTTYYYQFYAVVNGTTYTSDIHSFTTTSAGSTCSISWAVDYSRFSIGSTNATIAVTGTVSGTSTANVSKVGIYLYDASGNYITTKNEIPSFSGNYNYFNVWYNVNSSLGYTLSRGTTYKAQFYAVINGVTYYSPTYKFTTSN